MREKHKAAIKAAIEGFTSAGLDPLLMTKLTLLVQLLIADPVGLGAPDLALLIRLSQDPEVIGSELTLGRLAREILNHGTGAPVVPGGEG